MWAGALLDRAPNPRGLDVVIELGLVCDAWGDVAEREKTRPGSATPATRSAHARPQRAGRGGSQKYAN